MKNHDKTRTSFVYDNNGTKVEVYSNLQVGDKLVSKISEISRGDFGASGLTFEYESFKKDDIYEVHETYNWKGVNVAYVLDKDGCLDWATPDKFKVIS